MEFTLANQVTEFQLRFSALKNSQNRDEIYATYSKPHCLFCAGFLKNLSGFFIRSEAPDIYFGKLEVTLAIDSGQAVARQGMPENSLLGCGSPTSPE